MYRFWWAKLRERDYLYDVGADGMIIIKWIFRKLVLGRGLKLCASGQGQVLCVIDCDKAKLGLYKTLGIS